MLPPLPLSLSLTSWRQHVVHLDGVTLLKLHTQEKNHVTLLVTVSNCFLTIFTQVHSFHSTYCSYWLILHPLGTFGEFPSGSLCIYEKPSSMDEYTELSCTSHTETWTLSCECKTSIFLTTVYSTHSFLLDFVPFQWRGVVLGTVCTLGTPGAESPWGLHLVVGCEQGAKASPLCAWSAGATAGSSAASSSCSGGARGTSPLASSKMRSVVNSSWGTLGCYFL